MKHILFIALAYLFFSCKEKVQTPESKSISSGKKETSMLCDDGCMSKSKSGTLACKLTTPELQKRKETVIARLKNNLIEKKELTSGYAYKFPGNDDMIDELTTFIKSERECCDFFTFNLSISGDKKEAWLELSGPEGVKEVLSGELGL